MTRCGGTGVCWGLGPWYRLASLPKPVQPGQHGYPSPSLRSTSPTRRGYGGATNLASPCGRPVVRFAAPRRAMPQVPFWPHELVEDYIADDEALGDLHWVDPPPDEHRTPPHSIAQPKLNPRILDPPKKP